MAESTLSENFRTLRIKVAKERGFGRRWDDEVVAGETLYGLNDDQKDDVKDCIISGLRNFYWPPADERGVSHVWSFMQPIKQLVTVADTWQYPQEGDFGGIMGDLTFVTSSTTYWCIPVGPADAIRKARQSGVTTTGTPRIAAQRPLAHDPVHGQRWEIILWPTPDAVYTLEYEMNVNPNALTDASRYPYGGVAHSETILESCLAVAETRMDTNIGVHAALFKEHLAKSISLDSQLCRAQTLGINRDNSDRQERYMGRDRSNVRVTYQGTQY